MTDRERARMDCWSRTYASVVKEYEPHIAAKCAGYALAAFDLAFPAPKKEDDDE